MNYCKHLKKRKNKPYCCLQQKGISLSQCRECINKEYRIPVKGKTVSYKTKNEKNLVYKNKNAQYFKNTVQNKLQQYSKIQNNVQKSKKMSLKSKKIVKLERNRYSVFTNDLKHCFLCGKKKEELHEIFAGRNRINSMKYGFVLPLCHECHSLNQNNLFFNEFWHKNSQEYWECNIGSRNEFIAIFRRNYL